MHTIQIIGYRSSLDPNTGKSYTRQLVYNEAESTDSLAFFNGGYKDALALIPQSEHFDLHYTTALCNVPSKNIPARNFSEQDIMPFDFDDIDMGSKSEYLKLFFKRTGFDQGKCIVINSGHGLHVIVAMSQPIISTDELDEIRPYYVQLCKDLSQEFFNEGLAGKMDTQRLSASATMRLPNTLNMKDKENPVMCEVISGTLAPQPVYLDKLTELVEPKATSMFRGHVDTKAVLTGCDFLNYCKDNQSIVDEPQWYAMMSTLAYIPEIGNELCHTYSKGHGGYNSDDTDTKYTQAKSFGKPRTCESISQVFPSCTGCKFYSKVKTPLAIKGDDYIKTLDTGFHSLTPSDPPKLVPSYDDLLKYFTQQHTFIVDAITQEIHTYNGKHWEEKPAAEVLNFATIHFRPTAKNTMRNEFIGLVKSTNVVPKDFFNKDNSGHINFNNGVLRLRDKVLSPHSQDYGFTYVLPYDYNPNATCPNFDTMLKNVTCGDESLANILLEYIGYAISGDNSNLGAKALILTGEGSNGKSTFLDVVKKLIGNKCYSTITLGDMGNPNARYSMVGKLFNICEEVDESELRSGTAIFKSIVTGAELSVKKLYADVTTMRIDAKIILACNRLPSTKENTTAIYRRMLIVPFNAHFNKLSGIDKNIAHRVEAELSGVYNRILKAYDKLIANNYIFSESTASDEALAEFKYNNSAFNQFVDDALEKTNDPEDFISSTDLMGAYNRWALENNITYKPSMTRLIHELKLMSVLTLEKRITIKKSRIKGYVGIKIQGGVY